MSFTLSELFISFLDRFDKWEIIIDNDVFTYSDYTEILRAVKDKKVTAFCTHRNHYTGENIIKVWMRENCL